MTEIILGDIDTLLGAAYEVERKLLLGGNSEWQALRIDILAIKSDHSVELDLGQKLQTTRERELALARTSRKIREVTRLQCASRFATWCCPCWSGISP